MLAKRALDCRDSVARVAWSARALPEATLHKVAKGSQGGGGGRAIKQLGRRRRRREEVARQNGPPEELGDSLPLFEFRYHVFGFAQRYVAESTAAPLAPIGAHLAAAARLGPAPSRRGITICGLCSCSRRKGGGSGAALRRVPMMKWLALGGHYRAIGCTVAAAQRAQTINSSPLNGLQAARHRR